jgi:hypothetical protein
MLKGKARVNSRTTSEDFLSQQLQRLQKRIQANQGSPILGFGDVPASLHVQTKWRPRARHAAHFVHRHHVSFAATLAAPGSDGSTAPDD